jgi:superfamily II DNA or RNA helicase
MLYDKIGILKLSTSAGKTLIAGMILKILNIPFLFIADKKGLIQQAWEEFTKVGLDCGICHSEKKIFKQSMCCTIGSISKINNLNEIKVLIFDECHHGGANQFQTFFSSFLPPIRIGLSATPEGNDPFKFALLKQFFGEIVYTVGVNELITEGFVAEPTIFFIRNKVKPEIDWNITEIKQVIENKNRNNIIKKIVNNNSDKHILILVNKQQHGEILNKLIDNSIYIDGRDSIKLRNEVKENIENGTQKIVIASGIFNEGISINSIEIIINASARKGRVEQIQKIGRGLRIKQGKTKVVMIDFEDNGNKILYKQHLTRKNEWKKEGFKNFKIVNESDIEDLDFTSFLD